MSSSPTPELPEAQLPSVQRVVVTNIDMTIVDMIIFMIRWSIACIPAMLIIGSVYLIIMALVAGCMDTISRH